MQCDQTIYSRGLNFPRPRRCSRTATHGTKCFQHSPDFQQPVRNPHKDDLLRAQWFAKYALKNKTCRNCLRWEPKGKGRWSSGRCSLLLIDTLGGASCHKFQPKI
jgi:hypothetical protein